MKNLILSKIKEYESIIIYRHSNPDLDAIGSQMGLYYTLTENYPNKQIYKVGDLNSHSNIYDIQMDEIKDDLIYKTSLAIIVDVAVSKLITDLNFNKCPEVIIIDHHQNDTDIPNAIFYQKSNLPSAASVLTHLIKEWNLHIPKLAATYLYAGMVGDTGRFMFIDNNNARDTFELASYLMNYKPDIKYLYNTIYTETLESKQIKNMFTGFEVSPNMVAYQINNAEKVAKSGLQAHTVARRMIGQMAGIKEIPIWASFTEDVETNTIKAEVRSRDITVVEVCKLFGGGGHNLACGATLSSWEEVDKMIKELDQKVDETK